MLPVIKLVAMYHPLVLPLLHWPSLRQARRYFVLLYAETPPFVCVVYGIYMFVSKYSESVFASEVYGMHSPAEERWRCEG
jgi:hypothetical protein